MTPKNQTMSRYERVKNILDAASGDSTADYNGFGKFWLLPLQQFLAVKIYGVQMIAPEPPAMDCATFSPDSKPGSAAMVTAKSDASCCCPPPATGSSEKSAAPAPKKFPGRGEKSGLIQALKGKFPFDGTQFPPFMWGGAPVSPSDIQFISDWIDDGCPETDGGAMLSSSNMMSMNVRLGLQQHPVSLRSTNQIKSEAGQLKQRKNAEFLSDDELCKLRYAVSYLKDLNQYPLDVRNYNNWAQLHGNSCQHGWEQFLPWHRMMLYDFEKTLQDVVPDVTLPYWDWPMQIYNSGKILPAAKMSFPKGVDGKKLPKKYLSGVVPTPLRCYLNKAAIDRLTAQGVPAEIAKLDGYAFNAAGQFFWVAEQLIGKDKAASYHDIILAELGATNPLWHELRFPGMFFDSNGNPMGDDGLVKQFHHHYPKQQDIDEMLRIPTWRVFGGGALYDQSFGTLDQEPHNTIHIWSGGESPEGKGVTGSMLNNLTAAYDPIFYFHHSNVDRMWAMWQENFPAQVAADPNGQLPGVPYIVSDSWNMRKLGYEYVTASAYFETHSNSAVKMLRTAKTGLNEKVLAVHQRATLKLHNVIPPVKSFGVRVFINQPDADEQTPTEGNPHFAGFFSFFGHGDCIGGPGHCAAPAPKGKFDHRPLGHNRPTNHRLDISEAVKRMAAAGAKDIEVKLVTLTTDDMQLDDTLRMEGVSINFH